MMIWVADLVEKLNDTKVYVIDKIWIKLHKNTCKDK